ncbi:MAG: relaxase, partial [Oscillospiraceae bacterium]|nr:relaxase [Oscillospiraceae bacterium]
GENYSENAILERISGKRIVAVKLEQTVPTLKGNKPSLLIDIQQKIQEGKGAGYEQWARIFNIKEMSRTLLFLQENKIDSYDGLVQKSAVASFEFRQLTEKIKSAEKRMAEIAELQKYIGQYGKTREVYKQYLSAKNRSDFFEEHRAEVTLHVASKKYFDSHGYGVNNKVPKIADLRQEYAILLAEKRKLYSGYRAAKDNMIALATAKENASRMLHIKPEAREQDILQTQKRRSRSYER